MPALDALASFEAGSVTVDTAVDLATPESAASTPLPVFDPVAVFGASSATSVAAVGHATPESAASTPLPVPGPVAVFGAGSATHDTAVEPANYDDADYGDMSSEGDGEQPSTAYLKKLFAFLLLSDKNPPRAVEVIQHIGGVFLALSLIHI